MSAPPVIIGAGLAGLLAAHAWPQCRVLEAAPRPTSVHQALLRFRTDAVARLTGIDFRRVRVHKAIWSENRFTTPNIRVANLYSMKVLGRMAGERSIWNLDPVDRYIAPDDLHAQLLAAVGDRIEWGAEADFRPIGAPYISTAPLPLVLGSVGYTPTESFERAPIRVVKFEVAGADVFQTVYFPDAETPMYRASITGSTLIVEAVNSSVAMHDWLPRAKVLIQRAFGLAATQQLRYLDAVEQRYGKIVPLEDVVRKRLLFALTQQHNIYSLGRFATWRNILLDDVVNDIAVIKRLLRSDAYAARLVAT